MGANVKRNTAASTYLYDRSYVPSTSMAVGQPNTSRSEPDLARQRTQKRSAPPQRFFSNVANNRTERTISQFITNNSVQPRPLYAVNGISQNKTNNQFICSRTDLIKSPSKPPVTEGTPKNKGESVWVGTNKINMFSICAFKVNIPFRL